MADTQAFVAPHRVQLTLSPVITDEPTLALRRMEMTERERLKLRSEDAWSEYLAAKDGHARSDARHQSRSQGLGRPQGATKASD